ncbi:MAG: lipocalin family protein [Lentisphaeria bacterium]|nr:lipocalin family protein [Lentisphaeria bacterium]
MRKKVLNFMTLIGTLLGAGCTGVSTENIEAVRPFKINSYLGVWYEQARLPHYFEEGLINPKATYRWGKNGLIEVINEGVDEKSGKKRIATAVAETYKGSDAGELKVSFFRPFYGKYRIIHLDENYTQAIVTAATNNYLWILSRERKLPQKDLQMLVAIAAEYGFDTDSLIYPQK